MSKTNSWQLPMLLGAFVGVVCFSAPVVAEVTTRTTKAIREDVSALLKSESKTSAGSEQAMLIREMAVLYVEISHDARLDCDQLLQGQKNKLWTRLTKIKAELQRRQSIAVRKKAPQHEHRSAESAGTAQSLATSVSLARSSPPLSGGGPIEGDYAKELIDLIEATIEPDHWNVNGGPGVIMYYRPAMALIVRARSEVQGKVGDTLEGVRAVGK